MGFKKFYNRDNVRWSHPELESYYEEAYNCGGFDTIMLNEDLPIEERRAYVDKSAKEYMDMFEKNMTDEDRARLVTLMAPGCPEEPDAPLVKLTMAKPKVIKRKKLPCILHIAAGGIIMCTTQPGVLELADTFNCVAVTLTYRTIVYGSRSPEALNDCHAAYLYLVNHAEELGINPDKIMIMGHSSGGHMSLSLCHRLKKYGIVPRGCLAFVPPLDNRLIYPSSHIVSNSWASNQSYLMAKQWLDKNGNDAFIPAEIFPGHATVEECVGLPPTFLHAFANDVYYDPILQYASKLNEAGVYVSLHAWHGTNHDGIFTAYGVNKGNLEDYPYANMFGATWEMEISDCLKYDLRRPWAAQEAKEEMQERVDAIK